MCVRHLQPRKDVRLRHFFLCDRCTHIWTTGAFDANAPLYQGETIDGYCLLCNTRGAVRLRTWFLCDICDRVARSIGRNHVAEEAIVCYWNSVVITRYPHLILERNDVSSLRPRRESDVSGHGPLDFLIRDATGKRPLFGIENKTGRSSIRDMSKFQLDTSDCDSILNHMRELAIPAYIIHAQVLELWQPPTVGFTCHGLWWSDVYRMDEQFVSIQMRRDESRGAAYFRKTAFSEIDTFLADIVDDDDRLRLVERFRKEGVPRMYHS